MRGWRVTYLGDSVVRHECQRVTRRRLNALTLRHIRGLAHLYRTHGYLFSRAGLYRRIEQATAPAPASIAAETARCEQAS